MILLALLVAFIGKLVSNKIFMGINKRLHDRIVQRVLKSKIQFFESNTQGRIINRFSKDVQTLDNLVFGFLEMIDYCVKVTISLIMVIFVSPWLMIVAIISIVYLYYLRKTCIAITQDPIRLKYQLMSPVNSLIQDAVNGLPTLRCLKQKDYFFEKLYETTDLQTSAHITSNAGNRYTAFRIDL